MAWAFLFFAGGLEVAWATGLKKLGVAFSWHVAAMTVAAMIASLVALYAAMLRLPLGIAYPIWTGIGSLGSIIVSVAIFHQTLSLSSVLGVTLLVIGMFLIGLDAH